MAIMNNLASNLRLLRSKFSYTQEQISAYLGITQSAYNKYEAGVNEIPMDKLEKLATIYNVEEYDLLTGNMEKLLADLVFAFRNNGTEIDLNKIAPFQKIVQNYLEMSHELEK
jgi:transcriptional regulator with XRE-family HTH domain